MTGPKQNNRSEPPASLLVLHSPFNRNAAPIQSTPGQLESSGARQSPTPNDSNAPRKPTRNIRTTEGEKNTFETIAAIFSWFLFVITLPFSLFFCLTVVNEFNRVVIFRLGRVRKGARGPGLVMTLPCIDNLIRVDLRTASLIVPTQDVLTRDSVTIRVDAVIYYCIYSPMDAVIQVENVHQATMFIAQTTLRNVVGSKSLIELLTSRETLSREIGLYVDVATDPWGVRVERVELKDISLPESLQRALASEAEAHREARAKIMSAEGELLASKALKEASDVMSTNKVTLQLRHLQILSAITAERNARIIFPFPMEMMTAFEDNPSDGKGGKGGKGGGGGGGGVRGIISGVSLPSFLRKSEVPKTEEPQPPQTASRDTALLQPKSGNLYNLFSKSPELDQPKMEAPRSESETSEPASSERKINASHQTPW